MPVTAMKPLGRTSLRASRAPKRLLEEEDGPQHKVRPRGPDAVFVVEGGREGEVVEHGPGSAKRRPDDAPTTTKNKTKQQE